VPPRSCLVLGATGLVGGHLVRLLLAAPETSRVTVVGRRALGLADPKLTEVVGDLGRPETFAEHLAVDHLFCCLGTTIKKAGSQEAFRKVDLDYPLAVARAGSASVGQYLIVTAVGADPTSSLFYNRVKGEVEDGLRAIPFPGGLRIFRPSMLLGERGERRPAERVAAGMMRATRGMFVGGLTRYRPIEAEAVARAMWHAALEPAGGVQVYEGKSLFAMAGG
jgi:uncharacterized protein YbjT (DUF2867 family)